MISDIRAGLANNLSAIAGLRTYAEIPDQPNIPCAIVSLNNIQFDRSFQRGMTEYNFTITVVVGRASERNSQARLDSLASNGDDSIKSAVENDKTLDGSAYDVRVISMDNIGAVNLNDTTYLGMDLSVTVYAE